MLRNAAQTFQRFVDHVLHGLHFCYAYIDDLLIASSSAEEHKLHLRLVLHLNEHGIVINPLKCEFGVTTLQFLGHQVDGVSINEKVKAIQDFPQPTSQHKLCEFCGLVNFYHRFLPHYATTTICSKDQMRVTRSFPGLMRLSPLLRRPSPRPFFWSTHNQMARPAL